MMSANAKRALMELMLITKRFIKVKKYKILLETQKS